MVAFFNDKGMKAEKSTPSNFQMSGKAKRLNQTSMEHLQEVLLDYICPQDAVGGAAHGSCFPAQPLAQHRRLRNTLRPLLRQ